MDCLQYPAHHTSPGASFSALQPFAVVLTLTHIYTPFTSLPIYASLEHIPRNLVEASHDLGASPWSTFRRVILPLSLPGVLAGATFAFVLTLGDFLAPLLVGGPSGIMISNVVVSLFGAAYNWPLGAAISFCMMVLVVTLLFITERLEKKADESHERWISVSPRAFAAASTHCWCMRFFISPSSFWSFIPSTAPASADFLLRIGPSTGIASSSRTARFGPRFLTA